MEGKEDNTQHRDLGLEKRQDYIRADDRMQRFFTPGAEEVFDRKRDALYKKLHSDDVQRLNSWHSEYALLQLMTSGSHQ